MLHAVSEDGEIGVRIGELSRRVGVSADVLRAWERRYGVLSPRRSTAGQRLYTAADEQRVRAMRASISGGYSPAVAARLALAMEPASPPEEAGIPLDVQAGMLREALDAYRDASANAILDSLAAAHGVESLLTRVLLPLLSDIGRRWELNEITVAQEHFASSLLVGWLRSRQRGWDEGDGPCILASCPPGEAHDLGLLCFCVLLRDRGYRISYLGASVPGASLFEAAERLQPDAVLISAVREEPIWDAFETLTELSDRFTLMLGGAGASTVIGEQLRALVLPQNVSAAADAIASALSPPRG